MQLALMVKYPVPGLCEARPRRVAIQRRPPCRSSCCGSRCPPSPCGRLSRPPRQVRHFLRLLRGLRHDPPPTAGVAPAPPPRWLRDGKGDDGSLPTFTDSPVCRGRRPALPRRHRPARRSQDWTGPPAAHTSQTTGEQRPHETGVAAPQNGPSTRVGRPLTTHGASLAGSSSYAFPASLAGTCRLVVPTRPYVVSAAPGPSSQPGGGPALSFYRSLRRPAAGLSSRPVCQRLVAHGARHR